MRVGSHHTPPPDYPLVIFVSGLDYFVRNIRKVYMTSEHNELLMLSIFYIVQFLFFYDNRWIKYENNQMEKIGSVHMYPIIFEDLRKILNIFNLLCELAVRSIVSFCQKVHVQIIR